MQMEKYLTYQIEELAADESFQQWMLKENKDAENFWDNFVQKYPEKQADIQAAQNLLRALTSNKQVEKYAKETQEAIAQFQASLSKQKQTPLKVHKNTDKRNTISFLSSMRRIAAGLLILLTLGTLAYFIIDNYFGSHTYQTTYGETQVITLPDGSKVTLNSNSILEFPKNWEKNANREVWLSGEAFFEVKKQENIEKQGLTKFIVHSANVDVEVLGTQFNVWNRKSQVAVVLNEGKVKLNIKDENKQVKTVDMLPNERVEVANAKGTFTKIQVKPQIYTSWQATKEFIFENTPLTRVAEKIEEVYGLRVKFQDKKMESETLTGTLSCKNEKLFFQVLSVALDVKIEKKGKEVVFSRKK
jgi:ferric-dicitrate binding protein FerR (iron transport regulator)